MREITNIKELSELEDGTLVSGTFLIKQRSILNTKTNRKYAKVIITDGSDDFTVMMFNTEDKGDGFNAIEFTGTYANSDYTNIVANSFEYVNLKVDTDSLQEEIVARYKPTLDALTNQIKDDFCRGMVKALTDNAYFSKCPAAVSHHHNYLSGLIEHSIEVAINAVSLARCYPTTSIDLILTGALLHDVGKMYVYQINDVGELSYNNQGGVLEHISLGMLATQSWAEKSCATREDRRKLKLIQHIIASHHGKLEYGSPIEPLCIEATIVNLADSLSAKANELLTSSNEDEDFTTIRILSFGNKNAMTPHYISKDFKDASDRNINSERDLDIAKIISSYTKTMSDNPERIKYRFVEDDLETQAQSVEDSNPTSGLEWGDITGMFDTTPIKEKVEDTRPPLNHSWSK